MPTTYSPADPSALELLTRTMARFHGPLVEAEATVRLMFASNEDGPPLKLRGVPCDGIVRINNLAKRAEGMADATITVDGDKWPNWSDAERVALLDHELYHLELAKDKSGGLVLDDLDRPRLKMRLHDYEMGGFFEVAKRHRDASGEIQHLKAVNGTYRQMGFDWGDDMAGVPEGDELVESLAF